MLPAELAYRAYSSPSPPSIQLMFAGKQRVVSAALTAFTPQLVFNTVTLAVMPVYGLMIAFPKTQLVRVIN